MKKTKPHLPTFPEMLKVIAKGREKQADRYMKIEESLRGKAVVIACARNLRFLPATSKE
jgi:phage terminase large subunit-like protein